MRRMPASLFGCSTSARLPPIRLEPIVRDLAWSYLGTTVGTRVQLCGRLVIRDGEDRVDGRLPSRQGRLLFAYLALNRHRPTPRPELIAALWPQQTPGAADSALSALLSKLRRALPEGWLSGRDGPRLELPAHTLFDVEAAREGLHRAESAVALGDWTRGWAPARVALHTATRELLPGHDAPWIHAMRRELEEVRARALECVARIGLGMGGPEVAAAKRAGRSLVEANPFSEVGYRYLIEALEREDKVAEGLQVYEQLRRMLRDELGIPPSPTSQELHSRLLRRRAA